MGIYTGKAGIVPKELYFKVYQNKENMKKYFVETPKNVMEMYRVLFYSDYLECVIDKNVPVFEPVFMTELEFKELPEFEGF